MLTVAYLSLGSNLGNREQVLRDAIRRLRVLGDVQSVSSLYETEPVDFTAQPEFLNCVVAVETVFSPQQLMKQLLEIESSMGRMRTGQKGPRTIDIDILLFGDSVVNSPEVTIPHPAMHRRRFVLEPLAEIAPVVKHPLLHRTAQELLAGLPQGQTVRKIAVQLRTNG